MSRLNLPLTIGPANAPITVKEVTLHQGFGCWVPDDREILIDPNQPEVGKHIVLVHEIMHVVESNLLEGGFISKEIPHEFMEQGAAQILYLLASAGLYNGPTTREIEASFGILGAEEVTR